MLPWESAGGLSQRQVRAAGQRLVFWGQQLRIFGQRLRIFGWIPWIFGLRLGYACLLSGFLYLRFGQLSMSPELLP